MKCKTIYIVQRDFNFESTVIEAHANLSDAEEACDRYNQEYKDRKISGFDFIVVPTLLY